MVGRILPDPVERFTQVLEFHDGGRVYSRETQDGPISCHQRVRRFEFDLCRKRTQFGLVSIDQFWMDHATVYGQRNRIAANHEAIIDGFWGLCRRAGSVFFDEVQDSYLLAKLLPDARSNGSRRIFEDSVPARSTDARRGRQRLLRALDERLAAGRTHEVDMEQFRAQTAVVLGPPDYPEEVWQRYREYERRLLEEGREALEQGHGIAPTLERWRGWMNGIARRRGNELDKRVLDVLSYECRAALHRCYSAVWCELLPLLTERFDLTEEMVRFHRLWQLEQSIPSGDRNASFHLFHGHILGLHPGAFLFPQTRTGGELIGEALTEATPGPAFRRLLAGLVIAMHEYADRCQGTRSDRRQGAQSWNDSLTDDLADDEDIGDEV